MRFRLREGGCASLQASAGVGSKMGRESPELIGIPEGYAAMLKENGQEKAVAEKEGQAI